MVVGSLGDVERVRFDPRSGTVPVVVQDAATSQVLMVAWADRAALEATLRTGEMHFYSRSRQELWHKGSTSGNVQRVRQLVLDCDRDTVLALVDPAGPACHTGARSCFEAAGVEAGAVSLLHVLWRVIEQRAQAGGAGSYTVRLLGDRNLRVKKLGEEVAELVAALAAGERERVRDEAADLLYHLLVALRAVGVGLGEVEAELGRRMEGRQSGGSEH